MWPKNLGEWGFWVAILALILAYPLNVLANLTSPKVKNWWAETSRTRLAARIQKLEDELTKGEKFPDLTAAENFTMLGITRLGLLVTMGIHYVLATGFLLYWYVCKADGREFPEFLKWFLFVSVILQYENYRTLFAPVNRFQEQTSPAHRDTKRKAIERLKSKLTPT